MPTQPPIPAIAESQEKILRNVGWQLAQMDNLAQRLGNGPFIAPDTRPSLGNLIGLMRVFNSLCSDTGAANDRTWNWKGVDFWQQMAGFKSDKTCREVIKVLESFGLIEVKDKWIANNKRRLHVRIVWERFLDDEITQDEEDLKLWNARHARRKNRKRQKKLFGDAHRTYSVATTGPIRCASPNASICDPPIYPPIHPQGGGEGEDLGTSKAEGRSDETNVESHKAIDCSVPMGGESYAGEAIVLPADSSEPESFEEADFSGNAGEDARGHRVLRTGHRQNRARSESQETAVSTAVLTAKDFTTEARRHGAFEGSDRGTYPVNDPIDVGSVQLRGAETCIVKEPEAGLNVPLLGAVRRDGEVSLGSPSVPQCLRGEFNDSDRTVRGDHLAMVPGLHSPTNEKPRTKNGSGPSTLNPQHSTLRSLATRLRRMGEGMGSPESVLRASQAAGYSVDEIDQIVTWYERQARQDGNGRPWWPYTLGQLATRLKDEQARLDGCTPAQGRWAGGKCGIWLSLAGEGLGPRGKGLGPDGGMVVPDKEQARRLDLREQARGMIRQRGINLLTKATQTPGEFQERSQKALQWINQGHWPETAFQTPQELWRLFEDILAGKP